MILRPPRSTLFPNTTLFRSGTEALEETATWLTTTASALRFVRYTPDSGCFFQGEDPIHLIRQVPALDRDRKSTRLNSSHANISYAVFCLKKTHALGPLYRAS